MRWHRWKNSPGMDNFYSFNPLLNGRFYPLKKKVIWEVVRLNSLNRCIFSTWGNLQQKDKKSQEFSNMVCLLIFWAKGKTHRWGRAWREGLRLNCKIVHFYLPSIHPYCLNFLWKPKKSNVSYSFLFLL